MPGQSLIEIGGECLIDRSPNTAPGSPYYQSDLPALPCDGLTPNELTSLKQYHLFLAMRLGLDPYDPCLQWFEDEAFYPTVDQMMNWEMKLLDIVGPVLREKGRWAAFMRCNELLGALGIMERKDFLSLPYAWVRDVKPADSEEERQLMGMRLEELAIKARDSLDVRAEAAILRQYAQINGLTFQDDERGNRELMVAIRTARRNIPDVTTAHPKRITGN